jgi:hypothetical protein
MTNAATISGLSSAPTFSAYSNVAPQSVTSGSVTKVQINTKVFDTANCFDTTLYRYTPNVAGYYQVNYSVYPYTTINFAIAYLYKNGSQQVTFNQFFGSNTSATGSCLIYMNGTTDYIELFAQLQGTTPSIFGRSDLTYFQAALVRGA